MALRTNYIQYIQAVLTLQLPGVDAGTAAKERKQQRHHEAAAAIAENTAVAAGGSRSCVGCFGRIGCGCWCCSLVQQYALLDNSA